MRGDRNPADIALFSCVRLVTLGPPGPPWLSAKFEPGEGRLREERERESRCSIYRPSLIIGNVRPAVWPQLRLFLRTEGGRTEVRLAGLQSRLV